MNKRIAILGAGPAGLSCGHHLVLQQKKPILFEKNDRVGGLCRTMEFEGCRFDLGPHRFFTKHQDVNRIWQTVLGDDVIGVERLTRILYQKKYFDYPLKPMSALKGLGPVKSAHAVLSYLFSTCMPRESIPANFEAWVQKEFGPVLYNIFFKTYTEKVWGVPCSQISADWAGQRIRGLSLRKAIQHALLPGLNKRGSVKSLVDRFEYPRLGAGMIYEKMAHGILRQGGDIQLNRSVIKLEHDDKKISSITTHHLERIETEAVFSSMPITELVQKLDPVPPSAVLRAAQALVYRDHLTVNLIVNRPDIFPDNWIYVHSPEVKMARIASYGNFSKEMIADPNCSAISVEYFVFASDPLWTLPNDALIRFASMEMEKIGLLKSHEVRSGFVVREKDSYPAYYLGYEENLNLIKQYLARFRNAFMIGRGGMFKYNNQDHSILSGKLAADQWGGANINCWNVNTENEYLEEIQSKKTENDVNAV